MLISDNYHKNRLQAILKQQLEAYSGQGANVIVYPFTDDEHAVYGLATVSFPERTRPANIGILARVEGDYIIIEEDRTDIPFIDNLLEQGVPRTHIILAYAGESLPSA